MKKILLIEDELDQIELVKIRLETSGFEFISALDGQEGLKKAKEEKPDLILLDIIMPKMDGYQVCAYLKDDLQTKDIPVIMFSATSEKDIERKFRSCGADDLIAKPYESKEMIAKIKTLLKE